MSCSNTCLLLHLLCTIYWFPSNLSKVTQYFAFTFESDRIFEIPVGSITGKITNFVYNCYSCITMDIKTYLGFAMFSSSVPFKNHQLSTDCRAQLTYLGFVPLSLDPLSKRKLKTAFNIIISKRTASDENMYHCCLIWCSYCWCLRTFMTQHLAHKTSYSQSINRLLGLS